MKNRFIFLTIPVLAFLFFSLPAVSDDSAHAWLMKMSQAARGMSYDGRFVYQHGNQLEAMRITHQAKNNVIRERLVSLNGAPREIIRRDGLVYCYLPDENSVMVAHQKAQKKSFPRILPLEISRLDKSYIMMEGGSSRISNRKATLIVITPRDQYRYGYRLWADNDTGLLLKADLTNKKGEALEQFMFTDVVINSKMTDDDFKPGFDTAGMVWHKEKKLPQDDILTKKWEIRELPNGFVRSASLHSLTPDQGKPMSHLVYSDGLAAVSVFIEKAGLTADSDKTQGENEMGAIHSYRTIVKGYQVTVVGEVPANTVKMIGSSIVLAR